jgi:hypothetical protein
VKALATTMVGQIVYTYRQNSIMSATKKNGLLYLELVFDSSLDFKRVGSHKALEYITLESQETG